MMARGINVELPNINKSEFTFTPDIENNSILFGIKGISRINNEIAKSIIDNRPYKSLNDFLSKVKINKIQSGCFDGLENKDRVQIMNEYIESISDKKQRLTLQNMQMLIREDCIPKEFINQIHVFNFNKYLKNFKDSINYILDERAMTFYEKKYDMDLISQNDNVLF